MKLACPYFNSLIEVKEGIPFSLVIENQPLFRRVLTDIHSQLLGHDGDTVLSIGNMPVPVNRYADIIESFAPFDINTKALLAKVTADMERTAVDEKHYLSTSQLLSDIERYFSELCFDLPLRTECRKLSAQSLIKAASVAISDDFEDQIEEIVSYMSLILDFDKKKLFVTVNMRSYFDDEEIKRFICAVRQKNISVLMIENCAHNALCGTERLVIDRDLCEF